VQLVSDVVTAGVNPHVVVWKLGLVGVASGVHGPVGAGSTGVGPEHDVIRSKGYVAEVVPAAHVAGSAATLVSGTSLQVIVDNGAAAIAAAQFAAET
jgi:hypothetical protein